MPLCAHFSLANIIFFRLINYHLLPQCSQCYSKHLICASSSCVGAEESTCADRYSWSTIRQIYWYPCPYYTAQQIFWRDASPLAMDTAVQQTIHGHLYDLHVSNAHRTANSNFFGKMCISYLCLRRILNEDDLNNNNKSYVWSMHPCHVSCLSNLYRFRAHFCYKSVDLAAVAIHALRTICP